MHKIVRKLWSNGICILSALVLMVSFSVQAEDSVCAVVKIEILQELTLERQGFEAELKISNVLDDKSIDNIDVDVWFKDENQEDVLASSDPNNTDAKFFIRVQSMDNILDVNGSGYIQAGDEAVIRWLIIPSPGASNGREQGTLYFVGADFNYTLDGEADTIKVAPDNIYVKPMPLLTLDYFLPRDVIGDDPFTDEVEAPEPFSLGVRVQNNGNGTAKSLKIDSAQPKIVENKQGLLINFELLSSYVQDEPVENSLLLNFGDIESNQSKVGRWQMEVTLSGKFTEFGATYTHASELGGELTSLLEATNTHFLIHDVLVDLPGRDNVRDFLAEDLEGPMVYESDGGTFNVVDQSENSGFSYVKEVGEYSQYKLTVPATPNLFYSKVTDPFNGQKDIAFVTRSDGKSIKSENAWLSKKQDSVTHDWSYFINLFDANGTDSYLFHFKERVIPPRAPVIQFIPQRVTHEGASIGFTVDASDPDGDAVSLSASGLPGGASFVDNGDGSGTFNWSISIGQAGVYSITYSATDGTHVTTRTASIVVNPHDDIDGDGLNDDWEMEHFNTLDYDGYGDFDGDGISNQDEHDNGTNPTIPDGPTKPTIISPQLDGETDSLEVELTVDNGVYDGPHDIVYQFEVYADEAMTQKVAFYNAVPQDYSGLTSWKPGLPLRDNNTYYWRVRAYDSFTYSEWVNGFFFVNTVNDLPSKPNLSSPANGAELEDTVSTVSVTNSSDIDNDTLYYEFALYSDSEMLDLIAESGVKNQGADGTTNWTFDQFLIDQKTYYWQVKVTDEHNDFVYSDVFSFVWTISNQAPPAPTIVGPELDSETTSTTPTLEVSNVTDPNNDVVSYKIELDKVNTFDSEALQAYSFEIDLQKASQTQQVSELRDNQTYYWRVKAIDTYGAESAWVSSSFFVNTENDAPSLPSVKNPGNEAWVDTLTPNLQLNASTDVDGDAVRYEFEVYLDSGLNNLVQIYAVEAPEVMLEILSDNRWYYWRARAIDDEELDSGWIETHQFFVNDNDYDDPPTLTWIKPVKAVKATPNTDIELVWEDSDPDSSAVIDLYFSSYESGTSPVYIAEGIAEDNDSTADRYVWNIGELEFGVYHLFAEIRDGASTITVKAPVTVEAIPEPVIPGNIIVESDPLVKLYESVVNPVTESISLRLDKAPEADVIVPIVNPAPDRLHLSTQQLIFNADNWNTPQQVILTPKNNCFVDEHVNFDLNIAAAVSEDEAFSGVTGRDVKAQVFNDDAPITSRSGSVTHEFAMCGLEESFSISVFGLSFHTYNVYLSNLTSFKGRRGFKIDGYNNPVIAGNGSIKTQQSGIDEIYKGKGIFFLGFSGKPDNEWVNPAWYKLKLRGNNFRRF
ncbi:Ig-like domain-containing protein [Kangiella sp. M94]